MRKMSETIHEMVVPVARLEKRSAEGETMVEMSKPEPIRVPPPLPIVPAPHVLVVPPVVGQYVLQPTGMPSPAHAWRHN